MKYENARRKIALLRRETKMITLNTVSSTPARHFGRTAAFPATAPRSGTAPQVRDDGMGQDRDSLYAEFAPLVRRLIRQYGKDADLREELVGEIYFRFCALLDVYDPTRGVPLRAYLVRQMTASVYTYARHYWRQQQREVGVECHHEEGQPGLVEDPTREWDDALALEQLSEALPAALAQLPPRQRQVIIWRYFDEFAFEDIGQRLSVQASTARSLLRHGLNTLRGRMAQTEAGVI